jgi:hypothetical protein
VTRPHGVRTFDAASLGRATVELWEIVRAPAGRDPALVVGVRSGGWEVAGLLPPVRSQSIEALPVTCRRPSTSAKARSMPRWIRSLPRPVRDRLRLLEHRWLTRTRAGSVADGRSVDAGDLERLAARLSALHPGSWILVVDDAVDTGATLRAVLDAIGRVAPAGVGVTTAAITVTTPDPIVRPDVALLDGWLCRFPWSLDA